MKRCIDFIGSLVIILLFLPFFPFIACAIFIETGIPIFVKLNRVSSGNIIKLYKFRTMIQNAHMMKASLQSRNERRDGPFFKIKNDPRLTKVGKLLRKFRLDELPQLVNVVKGELSLVGPRPHEPEEVTQYPKEFRALTRAKGGITGLSQISGASGLSFLKELEFDEYYIEHKSLWLDLKILLKTVWIFFSDPTGV